MRQRDSLFVPAALAMALWGLASSGCGGSNSETPWPIEPDDVDLEPEGEARHTEELSRPSSRVAPAEGEPAPQPLAPTPAPSAPPPSTPPPAADPPSTQF